MRDAAAIARRRFECAAAAAPRIRKRDRKRKDEVRPPWTVNDQGRGLTVDIDPNAPRTIVITTGDIERAVCARGLHSLLRGEGGGGGGSNAAEGEHSAVVGGAAPPPAASSSAASRKRQRPAVPPAHSARGVLPHRSRRKFPFSATLLAMPPQDEESTNNSIPQLAALRTETTLRSTLRVRAPRHGGGRLERTVAAAAASLRSSLLVPTEVPSSSAT
jgi:hypothetical protein